ncbi:MAG: M23 family metallopeptidase [Deltaproteobacteria bacterium]|nr:M23 family metallopeptidase [Deltaproteobacteria bacterium]
MEKALTRLPSTIRIAALTAFALACSAAVEAQSLKSYVYPLLGTTVSSDFGSRRHPVNRAVRHHNGIDLAAPHGAQIRAVKAGKVVFSDWYAGYGKLVVIQHEAGLTTHYGHCQTLLVQPGQKVTAGQIIGTVGSTGLSTGPHLHFEMRVDGIPHAPEKFIPGLADDAVG